MTTTTLTGRYVHEVVRRIPAGQRDEVARELAATIADTVEARPESDPRAAERAVLTEMGDPIRLAAGYADRPLALIGPELYPSYVRVLRLLLLTVLPIVTVVMVVLDVLDKEDLGSAIGTGIGTVLTVGAQMFGWLTLVYALIDRSASRQEVARSAGPWTPDDLPDARDPDERGLYACAAAAWNAFLLGLIVWQHTAPESGGGSRVQVLDPALWSGWIWPVLAGLAALTAVEVTRFFTRRWTIPLATAYAVASAVAHLPVAWLLSQEKFLNPGFLERFAWTPSPTLSTVTALAVLAVAGSEIFSRFRAALA